MKQSPLATTRMECLKLIGRFGDEEIFAQAIIRGLKDRYELLRRNAATYAWQSSRLELLPALYRQTRLHEELRGQLLKLLGDVATMVRACACSDP